MNLNGEPGRRMPIGSRTAESVTVLKYLECVDRRFPELSGFHGEDIQSGLVQEKSPPTGLVSGSKSRRRPEFFITQTDETNVVERYGAECIPLVLQAPSIWHGKLWPEDNLEIPADDDARTEFVDYPGYRRGYLRHYPEERITGITTPEKFYAQRDRFAEVNRTGFPDRTPIGGFYADEQEFAVWDVPLNRYHAWGFDNRSTYWGIGCRMLLVPRVFCWVMI